MADAWTEFRELMPVTRRWAFFDHAADAPLPQPTREAILDWLNEATHDGGMAWPRWNRRLQEVRRLAADYVHASPDEIALVRSTTEGINLIAEGLDWRAGDNVVTLADEFPSNQYPWINQGPKGVETRRVPAENAAVDLNRLDDACDQRTRVISVSWVGYVTGWRNDLNAIAEIAHRHGALFFLDAIQGMGAFSLDVSRTPIDFFAADGHKWMLGPEGAGFLFIRREHLDRLRAIGVGWNSVTHAHDFTRIELNLKPSADRYEGGAPNSVGFIGLGASLELLARLGAARVGERILDITDQACRRLTSIGAVLYSRREQREHSSGIVSFEIPGLDSHYARKVCIERGVALSYRLGRVLRISLHAYNNEADIERLVEAVEYARQTPPADKRP